jgi:probable F420-dependent oxidoreductase
VNRWGVTIPLAGIELSEHRELVQALPSWGYTDVWSSEVSGADAFTPLAAAAVWTNSLHLGTAIVPAFTRGPALIAQSAATLAGLAPGRFTLGLGASSPAIVEQWNGLEFSEPYRRTRDALRMVRAALNGEKVSMQFDTFTVRGFRLENPPEQSVEILLAALRPQMLALAGREADGTILNWLSAQDVPRCVEAMGNPDCTVAARIFVCPTEDRDFALYTGRRMIAAYLTVNAYAQFQRWLGRTGDLSALWSLWEAGERAAAVDSVTEAVVDALVINGSIASCRDQVQAYVDAGVTVPIIALVPTPELKDAASLAAVLAGLGRR